MGSPAARSCVCQAAPILVLPLLLAAVWGSQSSGFTVYSALNPLVTAGLRGNEIPQTPAMEDEFGSNVRSYVQGLEATMLDLKATDLAAMADREEFRQFNYKALSDKLQLCELRPKDCNNDTVIVTGREFWWVLFEHTGVIPDASGEMTLAKSLLSALESLQILTLYAHEEEEALFFSRSLHSFVRATFAGMGAIQEAVYRGDQSRLPTENYDTIPYSYQGNFDTCNVLTHQFWGAHPDPSRPKDNVTSYMQVMTPYPVLTGNSFLGFSAREDCSSTFVPFEERKSAGLLWGKHAGYLNVTNLGRQSRERFQEVVGSSQFLLGLGHPRNGPTLLEALCQGTPFINPVIQGPFHEVVIDKPTRETLPYEEPSDFIPACLKPPYTESWSAASEKYGSRYIVQHAYAETIGPPYVYRVELNNVEQLLSAIRAIQSNPPTKPFIPEQFKRSNHVQRVAKIVRHPWCSWVSDPLAARGPGRAAALYPYA